MLQNIKVSPNRSVTPKRIVAGNQFETGVEQIHFDLPDMEGYKYLVLNKPNKKESYPIPLDEGTFYVDSRITYYLDGVWIANVVISKSEVTTGKLNPEVVTFISDDIILIVKKNYINNEYLEDLPLPQNLQIVYDKLFDTYTQIKSDYDSGAFDGKDGYSPTLDVTSIDNGNRITITDINGEKEIDVTNGIDGQSAYELAVKNGFEGTEEEWLESLRYDHSEEFTKLAEQVKKDATDAENSASEAKKAMNQANTTAQENVEAINQASTNAQNAIATAKGNAVKAVQSAQQTAENAIGIKQTEAVQSVDTAKTSATQAIAEQKDSAVSAITQEKNSAIDAIATGKKEALTDIETDKTGALNDIETAKNDAIEEIENTGVPLEDIEKLAIKETAEGNSTIINDSADWRLQSLNVYGQSSQDGTPTPENPIEIISKEVSEIKVTNGADLSQTITLTEPITLRGIPVDNGGNVTIDGQQYVSDILCEKDGVYGVERNIAEIKKPKGTHFDFVKEIYSSSTERFFSYYSLFEVGTFNTSTEVKNKNAQVFSNFAKTQVWGTGPLSGKWTFDLIGDGIRVNPPLEEFNDMTAEKMNTILSSIDTVFIGLIGTPTFEPLPENIQSQIKALRTYYPNTVIDTGAWTKVKYVADTQKWIEKKLTGVTELALGGK